MSTTTSGVRRASTEPVKIKWQTRSGSALVWHYQFGVVQTSFSIKCSLPSNRLRSKMRNARLHHLAVVMKFRDRRNSRLGGRSHDKCSAAKPAENIQTRASQKKQETMERKTVERRTVLRGSAAAAVMLGSGASASMVAGVKRARVRREGRQTVFPDEFFRRRAILRNQYKP
jgi:hypothetical protein